jgi:hypothetical protein
MATKVTILKNNLGVIVRLTFSLQHSIVENTFARK